MFRQQAHVDHGPQVEYRLLLPGGVAATKSRGPGRWRFQVEQADQGDSESLGNSEQVQVGRIWPSPFKATDVGAVESALASQILLRPAFPGPQLANACAQSSEGSVGFRARWHLSMLTTVYMPVYRPGSTHPAPLETL